MGGMSSRTSRAAFEVYSSQRTCAIERREIRGVFRSAATRCGRRAGWRAVSPILLSNCRSSISASSTQYSPMLIRRCASLASGSLAVWRANRAAGRPISGALGALPLAQEDLRLVTHCKVNSSHSTGYATATAASILTGKVKPRMRLRRWVALLSSFHGRENCLRHLSWNSRSNFAPGHHARCGVACACKTQRLGAYAEGKISGSFGCSSRRWHEGVLFFSGRRKLITRALRGRKG